MANSRLPTELGQFISDEELKMLSAAKKNTTFTPARKRRYVELVAKTGQLGRSALAVGVSIMQADRERREDPDFALAVNHALEAYSDFVSGEVRRRAIEGWDEPVWYQGVQVGTVRRYSDKMLELEAKRVNKGYRDHLNVDATVRGGVLVVPCAPQAGTPKDEREWADRYNGEASHNGHVGGNGALPKGDG